MSNVTRFGVEPTLDNEIANKSYVDSQAGGTSRDLWSCERGSYVDNQRDFGRILGGDDQRTTTESSTTLTLEYDVQLNAVAVRIVINSKNANTLFGLREDGTTRGLITIAAAATGYFENTGLTDDIAAGDLINEMHDTALSSSGSLKFIDWYQMSAT